MSAVVPVGIVGCIEVVVVDKSSESELENVRVSIV